MMRAIAAGAALLLSGCVAAAQQQDRQIAQLPQASGGRLSADLAAIVATRTNFVGVTRGGGVVVRSLDGPQVAQDAFLKSDMTLIQPTAPTRAVNELIVSLTNANVPLAGLPTGVVLVERVASGPFAVVRVPNGITAPVVEGLLNLPGVTRIEPNYPFFMQEAQTTPNDTEYPNQWALDRIRAERAWAATTKSNVLVAVLDTGIDISHPDLAANLWTNAVDKGKDEDGNGCAGDRYGCDFTSGSPRPLTTDPEGHGTHVAGTIGARGNNAAHIAGLAWDIKVLGVGILGADLLANASDVVKGIDYAIATKARIINASFGSYLPNSEVEKAVARAGAAGILIVAAAGNSEVGIERDNDKKAIYPASYKAPHVVAVMASNRAGQPATESRYGATTIHLAAPGVTILGLEKNGGLGSRTGTSMAAPFVSGTAALYWQLHPKLSAADVASAIQKGVSSNVDFTNANKWRGVLDLAFFTPKPTFTEPAATPAAPKLPPQMEPTMPPPLPASAKPQLIGQPQTWTGRLQSIFAAGGETSGLALLLNGQRLELTGSQAIIKQLMALVGQVITVRGQEEQVKGVERLRNQVRVTELVKQ